MFKRNLELEEFNNAVIEIQEMIKNLNEKAEKASEKLTQKIEDREAKKKQSEAKIVAKNEEMIEEIEEKITQSSSGQTYSLIPSLGIDEHKKNFNSSVITGVLLEENIIKELDKGIEQSKEKDILKAALKAAQVRRPTKAINIINKKLLDLSKYIRQIEGKEPLSGGSLEEEQDENSEDNKKTFNKINTEHIFQIVYIYYKLNMGIINTIYTKIQKMKLELTNDVQEKLQGFKTYYQKCKMETNGFITILEEEIIKNWRKKNISFFKYYEENKPDINKTIQKLYSNKETLNDFIKLIKSFIELINVGEINLYAKNNATIDNENIFNKKDTPDILKVLEGEGVSNPNGKLYTLVRFNEWGSSQKADDDKILGGQIHGSYELSLAGRIKEDVETNQIRPTKQGIKNKSIYPYGQFKYNGKQYLLGPTNILCDIDGDNYKSKLSDYSIKEVIEKKMGTENVIIVYGSSGSGKTHLIDKSILKIGNKEIYILTGDNQWEKLDSTDTDPEEGFRRKYIRTTLLNPESSRLHKCIIQGNNIIFDLCGSESIIEEPKYFEKLKKIFNNKDEEFNQFIRKNNKTIKEEEEIKKLAKENIYEQLFDDYNFPIEEEEIEEVKKKIEKFLTTNDKEKDDYSYSKIEEFAARDKNTESIVSQYKTHLITSLNKALKAAKNNKAPYLKKLQEVAIEGQINDANIVKIIKALKDEELDVTIPENKYAPWWEIRSTKKTYLNNIFINEPINELISKNKTIDSIGTQLDFKKILKLTFFERMSGNNIIWEPKNWNNLISVLSKAQTENETDITNVIENIAANIIVNSAKLRAYEGIYINNSLINIINEISKIKMLYNSDTLMLPLQERNNVEYQYKFMKYLENKEGRVNEYESNYNFLVHPAKQIAVHDNKKNNIILTTIFDIKKEYEAADKYNGDYKEYYSSYYRKKMYTIIREPESQEIYDAYNKLILRETTQEVTGENTDLKEMPPKSYLETGIYFASPFNIIEFDIDINKFLAFNELANYNKYGDLAFKNNIYRGGKKKNIEKELKKLKNKYNKYKHKNK